jgi:acetoin:2,6-dichlorophenolindophenol oxidoreductase subunit beta
VPVIAEIMFSDFIAVCFDMLANEIAKSRYMTNGQMSFPLVVRTANGGGCPVRRPALPVGGELVHDDPRPQGGGPLVCCDVVGLMAASIRDPDPVVFFEHKSLMAHKGEGPRRRDRRRVGQGPDAGGEPTSPSPPWL